MVAPEPQRRRTRRPRAEREAEILSAAREVFSEQGYAAAAVAEIAGRAGVVEGTVYSYFESKRALLIAVMRVFYEELISETERGLQAVADAVYGQSGEPLHMVAGDIIYSNPLPHVLMLTAIVVGVATLSVGLALVVRIREAYGTIEMDEVRAADIAEGEAEGDAA